MTVTGGCACGAVRFSIDADPITQRACWCRDCQYWASGNAAVNAVFPRASFSMTGATAEYASEAASGNMMRRQFCPQCGTPLTSETDARPHLVVIRAGALDRPLSGPEVTIWTASAPEWGHIDPDLPTFEGQPPPPAAK